MKVVGVHVRRTYLLTHPTMANATTKEKSLFVASLTNPPFDSVLHGPIDQNREMFERFECELGCFLASYEFDFDRGMVDRIQEELAVLKNRVATALVDGFRRTAPRSVRQ